MSNYHDQLRQVGDILDKLHTHRDALAARSQELEAAGVTDASPYWRKRDGKPTYLYLVHPQVDGERVQEYIGADPGKQAEALVRVERRKQHRALKGDLTVLQEYIDQILWRVSDLEYRAETAARMYLKDT